jgi:hypothetical protein
VAGGPRADVHRDDRRGVVTRPVKGIPEAAAGSRQPEMLGELAVLDVQEELAREAAVIGKAQRRLDTVDVHVSEALRPQVAAGTRVVVIYLGVVHVVTLEADG